MKVQASTATKAAVTASRAVRLPLIAWLGGFFWVWNQPNCGFWDGVFWLWYVGRFIAAHFAMLSY